MFKFVLLAWTLKSVSFAWAQDTQCQDTHGDSSDCFGRRCPWYLRMVNEGETDQCGSFDDGDFIAAHVCCACGGGSTSSWTTQPPTTISTTSTASISGTQPPRSQNGLTTRPPRKNEPRGGEDTTGDPRSSTRHTTEAPRAPTIPGDSTSPRPTRPTPPPRQAGCFAFNEAEMDLAHCDHSNAKNCDGKAQPGDGTHCPFTCATGYYPPAGGADQLYMTCTKKGSWIPNAVCVSRTRAPRTSVPRATTTVSKNVTVGGNSDRQCDQSAWGSSDNIFSCIFRSGVLATEFWLIVGVVVVLVFGLVIGIVCCMCRKNSVDRQSLGIQLNNRNNSSAYDWSKNKENYDKL